MKPLSEWLKNHGKEVHKKALDYLNNKGFFCKNLKLSELEQIREIEKQNSRDLYFKDCERKLKNNIRQQKSLDKNPMIKQHTFRISTQAHSAIKSIANAQGTTISEALERIIMKEYHSMYSYLPLQPNYNQANQINPQPYQQPIYSQNSQNIHYPENEHQRRHYGLPDYGKQGLL